MPDPFAKSPDYAAWLVEVKSRIRSTRTINRKMILLYQDIGHKIVEKQERRGWGQPVIYRLARDLRTAFPAVTGF